MSYHIMSYHSITMSHTYVYIRQAPKEHLLDLLDRVDTLTILLKILLLCRFLTKGVMIRMTKMMTSTMGVRRVRINTNQG